MRDGGTSAGCQEGAGDVRRLQEGHYRNISLQENVTANVVLQLGSRKLPKGVRKSPEWSPTIRKVDFNFNL